MHLPELQDTKITVYLRLPLHYLWVLESDPGYNMQGRVSAVSSQLCVVVSCCTRSMVLWAVVLLVRLLAMSTCI